MKKTISLILAIVLSLTVFVTDIAGITMIVRADDYSEEEYVEADLMQEVPEGEGNQSDVDAPPQNEDEDEAARQEAYEKAAREAQEAADQAAADAAAQEAIRKAQEEDERAAKEAEDAAKAAEEKKKAEEDSKYSIIPDIGSIDFGSAPVGVQRDYIPLTITNVGNNSVDLIYTKSVDPDGAFSLSLHGDKTHLEPGESTRFNVSMSANLGPGEYFATADFADATRDPAFLSAFCVPLYGVVTNPGPVIKDVVITPSKITLSTGGSAQFKAEVISSDNNPRDVRWTVTGNRSTGTKISDNGMLSVASDESAPMISIIATCLEDTSVSATAQVSLQRGSFNVTAYAEPSNGGSVTGGGAVTEGGSVTLSAVPTKNYYFVGWVLEGKTVSTATNYTVTNVTKDMSLTAKFDQQYVTVTATANNSDAGNVVGGGTVTYGGSTTLSAKAYDGYVFTGWKENDTIVSRDASIKLENLTVNRKLTAIFEKTRHTLTLAAYPTEGGSVTGGGTFKLDEGTTIKATAANGYTFQGWQVNGQYVSRSAEYRIDKIKQDFTCTAIFTKNNTAVYELSSGIATTGGSITPSGKISVLSGQNITYTITPKAGFAILAVAVDGAQVGPVSTYTFNNIQGNHVIAAAFVQTDAGKAAAEASGKKTQTNKVKPIEKTLNNTATASTVVDIDDAATGKGGDNYVEEMDLENIPIPTDEELGITVESERDESSEVTRLMGISMSEATEMVTTGDTMPILDAAFYTGGLGAYVYNKFEPSKLTSIDYNKLSREELMQASDDEINPSLPDLDVVVQKMLTTDDVMRLAKGDKIDISVSITGEDQPDAASERIMKNAVGQKPLKYFDVTMLKTMGGNTEKITELPTTMEVIIEIPEDIYQAGKTYSVLRVHNGELTILPDLDDDPKTITFRTDRFSAYAIAREVATARNLVTGLAVGALLAFGVAVTCFLILIVHQRKMRKMKRKAAH